MRTVAKVSKQKRSGFVLEGLGVFIYCLRNIKAKAENASKLSAVFY